MQVPDELQPLVAASKFDRGELTVEVAPENLLEALRLLKDQLQFERMSDLTAVDRFPAEPRFEVVYHLQSIQKNQRLRLKCHIQSGQPEIDSATAVWRSANWFEREVFDLFGIRFRNHPDLRRILMPDDWEGHPLRKDFPVTGYL
ncbi:MAG: NADH-quinone oxidoreductase subunit C [Bryobacteraceae bacterium]